MRVAFFRNLEVAAPVKEYAPGVLMVYASLITANHNTLPGFEDRLRSRDDNLSSLPGFEDAPLSREGNHNTLPGFEDAPLSREGNHNTLPGFEDAPLSREGMRILQVLCVFTTVYAY